GGGSADGGGDWRRGGGLAEGGGDTLDCGGESTRPGARPVWADGEGARLLPVLERLLKDPPCPISVDTVKPEVAEAALALGVHMVNDVTGLAAGPDLARVCARHGAALCLVHMQGTPATLQEAPHYDDLLGEVRGRLADAAGVGPDAICVDPGIGFGKTLGHNLTLLKRLDALAPLGKPILVGPSRKRFIGALLGAGPSDRLEGTLAACVMAVQAGVHILRVHDVAAVRRAVRVAEAIRDADDA